MADPGEGLYLETHIMHTMGHALDEGMAHCASETKYFRNKDLGNYDSSVYT